jgi:hypothetical protein
VLICNNSATCSTYRSRPFHSLNEINLVFQKDSLTYCGGSVSVLNPHIIKSGSLTLNF